jgi:ABC-type sugar transport system ATPase subunit
LGLGIVFISHFIDEVYEIAEKVVVLRDGQYVGGGEIGKFPQRRLEELMVGRSIDDRKIDVGVPQKEVVLSVENLSYANKVQDVSFKLHKGEVLGFSGLMGAGRTELVESIYGLRKSKGRVLIYGKPVEKRTPRLMKELGIAFVPEDRRRNGLFIIRSLKENLTVSALRDLVRRIIPGIGFTGEKESAEEIAQKYRIVYANIEKEVNFLSGGNQQKALLARWLAIKPKICILDEPTRGVDIGAKEEIHSLIGELARRGTAVILVSSELEELMLLSHRIIILRKGKMVAELPRGEFDPLKIISHIAASTD